MRREEGEEGGRREGSEKGGGREVRRREEANRKQ